MPLAAPPALLLPLLGLAAAAVADCPSSTWIQFQDNCYIFLQEAIKVESIEDVRNQCTDHGADMISIHNEEENAFILDTLKKQWKGSDDILLGMFYDTDDASFKWFDNSNMTFDKWTDQDDGEDLIDTCAFLHIKTGEWKKGNCEVSFVEGTLCKTAIPYKRKYLSVFSTAPQSPYNEDCVLVVGEENEYPVQFDIPDYFKSNSIKATVYCLIHTCGTTVLYNKVNSCNSYPVNVSCVTFALNTG
ncbi:CD302 antigen isoform X3 [Papio anubis]|uniref:CD302 antigen isoform X3 n=1 Tax=Papio anubis TaxID=9555 RepID=UPI0004F22A2C|nr:CD302 antigen isoform X3 [Papio anubis]